MLILLHPVGLDGACWKYVDLPRGEDALAYTMLAHDGRAYPAAMSMADLADDVAARTSGALDIVGISLGGSVAQHIALRHPARVRSLLIAATGMGGSSRQNLIQRAEAAERGGMASVLESTLERWFTPEALRARAPGVEYARQRLLADDPRAFAATWRALAQHDTKALVHTITAPATVVHARGDAAGGPEQKRELARTVATGRYIECDGPHMLHLERPAEFSALIRQHLDWARSIVGT